jgi:hypothetical protein
MHKVGGVYEVVQQREGLTNLSTACQLVAVGNNKKDTYKQQITTWARQPLVKPLHRLIL